MPVKAKSASKPASKTKTVSKSDAKTVAKAAVKPTKVTSGTGRRAKALVVVESPAKAKTIKKYLGND